MNKMNHFWHYVIMWVFIGVWIMATHVQNSKDHTIIIKQNKQLLINDSIMINYYQYSDSLHQEHIRKCAFISSDEVEVAYNGYFRKKDVKYDLANN